MAEDARHDLAEHQADDQRQRNREPTRIGVGVYRSQTVVMALIAVPGDHIESLFRSATRHRGYSCSDLLSITSTVSLLSRTFSVGWLKVDGPCTT